MLPADAQLVSVDDHVIEHSRVFLDHLPAKYADVAPHIVEIEGGRQMWKYEDRLHATIGLNAVAGKDPKDFGTDPVRFVSVNTIPIVYNLFRDPKFVFGVDWHFDRIDLLVNNAGIYLPKPFTEYTPEDFELMIGINVAGCFFITQQVVAQMRKQKSGHIVSISTVLTDHSEFDITENE